MAEETNEEVKSEYEVKPETSSTIELVRNPYIAFYLYDKQIENSNNPADFKFLIDEEDIIPINQDILYNDKVSAANNIFKYSNRVKEQTNIRYVKSNSEVISSDYRKTFDEYGATDDLFFIPVDYIYVKRNDGSEFMIAEDFSNTNIPRGMHRYSVLRYESESVPFKQDLIYSDGIDLSRILSDDKEYIDVFANSFLSEMRLNKSLKSTFKELESEESKFGGGYVGYIDSNDLSINSSLEKNELVLFERDLMNGGMSDE